MPVADVVGPMPYPAMFAFTKEATRYPTQQQYARSVMVDTVDDALISALLSLRGIDPCPSPGALLELRVLGGAMKRGWGDGPALLPSAIRAGW